MTNKLDYHRPVPTLPWYRSDLLMAPIPIVAIAGVNGWFLMHMDQGWGFLFWIVLGIIPANAALFLALLAMTPLVRLITGMSASLYVWLTVACSVLAAIGDVAYLFG
ncbi:MAG TPA: hypothetical protein VFE47_19185 [Tepidisphaeraceae bacterium]|jgi:hypothetical protein|nr:hypothetical protein [Tepidisphaeraceae bacterium]